VTFWSHGDNPGTPHWGCCLIITHGIKAKILDLGSSSHDLLLLLLTSCIFTSSLSQFSTSMADIPHPSCFGLKSSSVEPFTPSPLSFTMPILPIQDAAVIHPVGFSSTPPVSIPVPNSISSMAPHATAPVYRSDAHPATPTTQPFHPFYFNNY